MPSTSRLRLSEALAASQNSKLALEATVLLVVYVFCVVVVMGGFR